jgi:hypothetical protein
MARQGQAPASAAPRRYASGQMTLATRRDLSTRAQDSSRAAIVSPLPAGATYTFYLINECPISVAAVWPDTVTVQVIGEDRRRSAKLNRTYTSPIDQIIVLMPSLVPFIGDHQCE